MRKFLIVLDDTPEMLNAMRYAAIRAAKTGGAVEMLAVISSEDFQHFMGVADVMRAEAQEKIEAHFQVFKDRMEKREGLTPTLAIREGDKIEAVLAHIRSDPEISVLVLGSGTEKGGPGELVTALTGRRIAEICRLCDDLGIDRPVVSQPYYNALNRMPETEHLPACAHYGLGVVPYSPLARGVLTAKYDPDAPPPEGTRAGRQDTRMMQTEWRPESLVIARIFQAHAAAGTGVGRRRDFGPSGPSG